MAPHHPFLSLQQRRLLLLQQQQQLNQKALCFCSSAARCSNSSSALVATRFACSAASTSSSAAAAAVHHHSGFSEKPGDEDLLTLPLSSSRASFPPPFSSAAAAAEPTAAMQSIHKGRRRFAATTFTPAAGAAAASLLLLLLCCTPAALQPAAAVLFELRSASSQCFYTPINQAPWALQGRFESFVGEGTAGLTIEGPVPSPDPKQPPPSAKSQVLFTSTNESALFKLHISVPGTYRLCATNRVNYTQTVALNFHVLPPPVAAAAAASSGQGSSSSDGSAASGVAPDMSNLVLSTHTDKLKDLSNQVLELANGLFDQQSTTLARLSVYEKLNSSTRSRATFWKVLQMAVQIVLSGIQVYAVRSRFEVKTIV